MAKISQLRPEDLNCNIFSCYDYDGCSLQEILCQFFTKINEVVSVSENTINLAEWLINEGLAEEVVKQLEKWLKDGTLADIIDKGILQNVQGRVTRLESHCVSIDLDQFGAKGDGVNDDTDAIQKALKYCWDNNIFELCIPAGKFVVTKPIETKEVKLKGLSKPFAPNPIGFDYAYPGVHKPELRQKYLDMCGGSIISCKENIKIFKDGLIAENIMIFGDVNQPLQDGISQEYGGPGQQVHLTDVSILCCGRYGIFAQYGLISARLYRCRINYNMGGGIKVDKVNGPVRPDTGQPYTGETNDMIVDQCNFDRNGGVGLDLNVRGRSFFIRNNSFEHQGYKSDQQYDPKGDLNNILYGCTIHLEGSGGFGTGEVVFENNYSESSLGLLYLNCPGVPVANNIVIKNNLWLPYNINVLNCGIRLGGYLFGVTIWDNKIYTPTPYLIRIDGNNVKGVVTNSRIDYNDGYLNSNLFVDQKLGDQSNPVASYYTTDVSRIGNEVDHVHLSGASYDPGSNETQVFYGDGDLNNTKCGFGFENDFPDNPAVGNILKVDDQPCGYISTISTHNRVIKVRGNFQAQLAGNKKVSFHEAGGLYMLAGNGKLAKLVVDNAGHVSAIIKYR